MIRVWPCLVATLMLALGAGPGATLHAQPAAAPSPAKGPAMTKDASGTFEVTLAPQPLAETAGAQTLGRMSISKTFAGDLQGTSKGEMLVAGTDVKGSAGYVAVERVEGRLNGRSGAFSLQHSGTLNRGAPRLAVTVVPDSGTGELAGIDGTLRIEIVDGKHLYEFDYTLADKE